MSLAVAISSSKYRMRTTNPLIRSTLAAVSVDTVAMGALASHARQLNLNFGEGKKIQGLLLILSKQQRAASKLLSATQITSQFHSQQEHRSKTELSC